MNLSDKNDTVYLFERVHHVNYSNLLIPVTPSGRE